ncbi:MAG: hypothetical protein JNL01_14490 [Bdellovibrionales bacterium]|nr:hypothetical protein [Bdellovibrionales bacterium]
MIQSIRQPSLALRSVAALVTLTMLSETSIAFAQTSETPVTKIALGTKPTAQQAIAEHVRLLNDAQNDKSVDKKQAVTRFIDGLAEANLTQRDFKEYAKSTMTREKYLEFSAKLSAAAKKAETEDAMPEDVMKMFADEINKSDKQTITGCAGRVAAWVLAAAAVTVGIIALIKARPVSAIQRKFNKKRRKALKQYNDDIYRIDQKPQELSRRIESLNEQNKQYANDIIFKTGEALGTSDPVRKDQLLREIQQLQDKIQDNNSTITMVQNELQNYQNPVYVANLKAQELNEYNADVREYNEREADLIAAAPDNHKLAPKLGIGAAAGAVVSALLFWDTSVNGGCRDSSSGRPTGRR